VNLNDEDKKKNEETIAQTIDAAYNHVFPDTYPQYKEQQNNKEERFFKNSSSEIVEEIITPGAAATQQKSHSSDHLSSLVTLNANLTSQPTPGQGTGMMFNQNIPVMGQQQQYPQPQFSQNQYQQHYINQQQNYMLMQQQQHYLQQQQRAEQMRQRGGPSPGQLPTLQRAPGLRAKPATGLTPPPPPVQRAPSPGQMRGLSQAQAMSGGTFYPPPPYQAPHTGFTSPPLARGQAPPPMRPNFSFSYSPGTQVPHYPPHPAQTMQMSPQSLMSPQSSMQAPQSSMQAPQSSMYPMQRMMPGPGAPMAPYIGANTGAEGMMMHQQVITQVHQSMTTVPQESGNAENLNNTNQI